MALVDMLKSIGHFKPYKCSYCEAKGILVSGPHSHKCACGKQAFYGWYTKPQCARCHAKNYAQA